MTGKFRITYDYLKELGACNEGLSAFEKAYPGGGEYQEILDRCCAECRSAWARWLLSKVGATNDVRTYDEFVSDEKLDIVFAGRIKFKNGAKVRMLIAGGDIKAGLDIEAGRGIEAGEGIKAGEDIKAGEGVKAGGSIKAGGGIEAGEGIDVGGYIEAGGSIKAGGGIKAGWGIDAGECIEAGEGYGIFAGLWVKVSSWKEYAKVIAKSKPENLISGYWTGDECLEEQR